VVEVAITPPTAQGIHTDHTFMFGLTIMAIRRPRYGRQDSDLPEWASEDAGASGGTFDSTGKFRSSGDRYDRRRGDRDSGDEDDDGAEEGWVRGQRESGRAGQQRNQSGGEVGKYQDAEDDDKDEPLVDEVEVDPDDLKLEEPPTQEQPLGEPESEPVAAAVARQRIESQGEDSQHRAMVSQLLDDDDDDLVSDELPSSATHPEVHYQEEQLHRQPAPQESQHEGQATFLPEPSGPPAPSAGLQYEWIYLDPQGQTQGPFANKEMWEWFSSGYFPADLMLRRSVDFHFVTLSAMAKLYGGVPFAPEFSESQAHLAKVPIPLGASPALAEAAKAVLDVDVRKCQEERDIDQAVFKLVREQQQVVNQNLQQRLLAVQAQNPSMTREQVRIRMMTMECC